MLRHVARSRLRVRPVVAATVACLSTMLVTPAARPAGAQLASDSGVVGTGSPPRIVVQADPTDANTFVPPLATGTALEGPTATFQVTYTGFAPAARTAFQRAVDIWAGLVVSPVPIKIDAHYEPLALGILGEAGPVNVIRDFPGAPWPNTWYPFALANALAGTDLTPSSSDIEAQFSSNRSDWYFGTDGNPPPGTYDFTSVVVHEIGHGLGFLGSMNVAGGVGDWGDGSPYPYVYDRFTTDGLRRALIDTSVYPKPSPALASTLQGGSVYFDSSLTNPSSGSERPRLYAPPTWNAVGSYSHLDEATYPAGTVNSLMTPFVARAESIFSPGPLALCILEATGWSTPQSCPPSLAVSATSVSATSGEPGGSVTVSATGAPTAGVSYVVKLGNTAGTCQTGIQIGGPRSSDGAATIPPTVAIVPTNVTSGTRYVCFARLVDSQDHTPAAAFTVL